MAAAAASRVSRMRSCRTIRTTNAPAGTAINQDASHPADAASARRTPEANTASRANPYRASMIVSRACVSRREARRARYSSAGVKNGFVEKIDEWREGREDPEHLRV